VRSGYSLRIKDANGTLALHSAAPAAGVWISRTLAEQKLREKGA